MPPPTSSNLNFAMPVIGPPPAGTDPGTHYASVIAVTTFKVTGVSHHGLKVTLSNASFRNLYAMTKGEARYYPPGDSLPNGVQVPTGAGALVIRTSADVIKALKAKQSPTRLPPGVPPMHHTIYMHVKETSVRSAFEPIVNALPQSVLKPLWDPAVKGKPVGSATNAELVDNYLDRFLSSENLNITVDGGQSIGEAEHAVPANPSSDIEFTLQLLDGAGNDLSPILHLRAMPQYGGAKWREHPLIGAVKNIAIPVNIWLKFEVWNQSTNTFDSLPQGVGVSLMESSNDLLGSPVQTDNNGVVHFNIPDLQAIQSEPDIFFIVHTNGMNHAGRTLPAKWSTKGWSAVDGSPGYYENFTGTQLGDALNPLKFRIGVDFHLYLNYRDHSKSPPAFVPAPEGIPIEVWKVSSQGTLDRIDEIFSAGATPSSKIRTNDNGQLHGTVFDVDGGNTIYFKVFFELEEEEINLPLTKVQIDPASHVWLTFERDDDRWDNENCFPGNANTSLGTASVPKTCPCTVKNRNVGLYFLKILKELSTFLFHMTQTPADVAWQGIPGLTLYPTSIAKAYSWPLGEVNIPPEKHWDRRTIIHEISHQLMWKEADIDSVDIAALVVSNQAWLLVPQLVPAYMILDYEPPELWLPHSCFSLSNRTHALIEGWAEFMVAIFDVRLSTPPYWLGAVGTPRKNLYDFWGTLALYVASRGTLPPPNESLWPTPPDPPDPNRGEKVEGAFANVLWAIFEKYVVKTGRPNFPNAKIPETVNGNEMTASSWMTNDAGIAQRFMDIIWKPLRDLRNATVKDTAAMISNIKLNNLAIWHEIQAELQNYNMAMDPPTIATPTNPAFGPLSGGTRVTIYGTNFVTGASVTFGGINSPTVTVINSTALEAETPRWTGAAQRVDVAVTTLAGTAVLPQGFEYRV